ncbi:hypothetical protein [Atopomonas hussainii]|uniref:hypothetical protein n=1 Tax=Atopomonas hussainii TaxID=1429083 RepID=UPI00111405C3|nr:hypothetical protein [Atopomonas hussainii]
MDIPLFVYTVIGIISSVFASASATFTVLVNLLICNKKALLNEMFAQGRPKQVRLELGFAPLPLRE